jgi:hypothetical protein
VHDPEKHALGLDPRVEAGFPNRSCTIKMHDPEKHALDPRVDAGFPNRPCTIKMHDPERPDPRRTLI